MNLPKVQDANVRGKIVLVRVDHNVVKKGKIGDTFRIDHTLGTLFHIVSRGGKLILMTHVGRPKKKTGEIVISDETSIEPIVEYLKRTLNIRLKVPTIKEYDEKGIQSFGDTFKNLVSELKNDEIDGIYLPNTRWFSGEQGQKEEADDFAKQLAEYADVYVNDAFGSWQPHASTYRITKFLPSYAGPLMQKEIENLEHIYEPGKPFLAVVAGSKFDTKIHSLHALLKAADHLVLGGVIYNAYLCAKYGIKIKGIPEEDIEIAKDFVKFAEKYPGKLVELPYIVESEILEEKQPGRWRVRDIRHLQPGAELDWVLDAAPQSFDEENVWKVFFNAKTIFVNAVMGFTPHFTSGTIAMYKLIATNDEALKMFGGGDTLQDMRIFTPAIYLNALIDPGYYLFSGGGAVLKAIEQGTPLGMGPVRALSEKNNP